MYALIRVSVFFTRTRMCYVAMTGQCIFHASASVGAFFNCGDDLVKVRRNIIEEILAENPEAEFVEINIGKVMNESYIETLADLTCIHSVCHSDISATEKIQEIKKITKQKNRP